MAGNDADHSGESKQVKINNELKGAKILHRAEGTVELANTSLCVHRYKQSYSHSSSHVIHN